MIVLLKRLLLIFTAFLTLLFTIFVINQTAQLVALANGISPVLGNITLYTLLITYGVILIVPLSAIFKRPAALVPPSDSNSAEYEIYLQRLEKRLRGNPNLNWLQLEGGRNEKIESALKILDAKAEEKLKSAASNVFIMTAISQYGALDAVIVLIAQFRIIWQVAITFNQRPTLKELTYLYSNVFATAFLATKIENLEILEDQLEPVIASAMGSSLTSVTPALNSAATIITNAIIQGSANAFLTLRVGVITRQYCSSLIQPEQNNIRKIAAVQASALLASVLGESTYKVTRSILRAAAKTGKRPFRYGHNLVKKTTKNTLDSGKETIRKSEELAKELGQAVKNSGSRLKNYFSGVIDGELEE